MKSQGKQAPPAKKPPIATTKILYYAPLYMNSPKPPSTAHSNTANQSSGFETEFGK